MGHLYPPPSPPAGQGLSCVRVGEPERVCVFLSVHTHHHVCPIKEKDEGCYDLPAYNVPIYKKTPLGSSWLEPKHFVSVRAICFFFPGCWVMIQIFCLKFGLPTARCEPEGSICGSFTLQLQMMTESGVITLHTVLQSSMDAWARFAALACARAAKINQTLDGDQRCTF